MWKDTDLYCKRDDDSAIGDSENNSAEEETMNFRRKSSVFEDVYEIAVEPHINLETKVGAKIPECLLKSCDDVLINCQRVTKNNSPAKAKTKREIIVLPNAAAAAVYKKPNSVTAKSVFKEHSILEAKLKFLLGEMKQLRELDKDIFRKFVELNENVEEVRLMLTEEEEDMKRKLKEEEEEEEMRRKLEEDIRLTLKKNPQTEVSFNPNNHLFGPRGLESSCDVTVSSLHASIAPENRAKIRKEEASNKQFISTAFYSSAHQPTPVFRHSADASIDACATRHLTEKPLAHESGFDPAERLSPSDVWIVRKEDKPPPSDGRKESKEILYREKSRPVSAVSSVPQRNNETSRSAPKLRSQSNTSGFKLVADEHTRIGRLTPWAVSEAKKDLRVSGRPPIKQRHSADVSRSGNLTSSHYAANIVTKASDSSNSLNSSSSRTSSESSSSVTVPAKNPVRRSNSTNKWTRFLQRRSSKSAISANDKSGLIITNNNYKIASVPSKQIDDPVLRNRNIVPVSYKRTSPVATNRWTHHQDDITFL